MEATETNTTHAAPVGPLFSDPENTMKLTEKAVQKVNAFATSSKEAEGKHLRVYVQGGGCSGFQYGFMFDEKRDDDQILPIAGIQVLLDPVSLPYLKGCTVDFVEDFRGSGFSVQNPNASGSCGCGHSFSV